MNRLGNLVAASITSIFAGCTAVPDPAGTAPRTARPVEPVVLDVIVKGAEIPDSLSLFPKIPADLVQCLPPNKNPNNLQSHLLINLSQSEVLCGYKPEDSRRAASLIKMLTLYTVMEQVDAGNASLNQNLTVSKLASMQEPSKFGLKAGQNISLNDALKGMMARSHNDMAIAIAENIGGSVDAFVQMMNDTAHQLGLSEKTIAINPNGLPYYITPKPDKTRRIHSFSTAYDLAFLLASLFENYPTAFNDYMSPARIEIKGRTFHHTALPVLKDGVLGAKTGLLRDAGRHIALVYRYEENDYLLVVMGENHVLQRNQYVTDLITQITGEHTPLTLSHITQHMDGT